jgi:hypothetical protein
MKLITLHRGRVTDIPATGTTDWWDKPWRTSFSKQPQSGPLQLGLTGLEGDEHADLINHGSMDKAVYVYPAEHYEHWRDALTLPDLPHGAFGENFTTQGNTEAAVCIGDVFHLSTAVVQISQPCWKLASAGKSKTSAPKSSARDELAGISACSTQVASVREKPPPCNADPTPNGQCLWQTKSCTTAKKTCQLPLPLLPAPRSPRAGAVALPPVRTPEGRSQRHFAPNRRPLNDDSSQPSLFYSLSGALRLLSPW